MDHERLKLRVQGRQQATAVIGLVDLPHRECADAFFDELRRQLLPEVVAVEAAKHQRTIRELSAHTLDFGQHAGKRLDEIDRDYLEWLLQSSEQTVSAIGAYLKATDERSDEE